MIPPLRGAVRRRLALALLGALLVQPARAGVQRIDPIPELGEMGSDAVLKVTTFDGQPVPGAIVRARRPASEGETEELELGATDGQGIVRFTPPEPGRYELRAWLPARELTIIAPYEVLSRPRRWLWAMVCVPAGLLLLWLNLRRWRAEPNL